MSDIWRYIASQTGWKQERFASEEIIKLDQLDLEWPLASVYEGVF